MGLAAGTPEAASLQLQGRCRQAARTVPPAARAHSHARAPPVELPPTSLAMTATPKTPINRRARCAGDRAANPPCCRPVPPAPGMQVRRRITFARFFLFTLRRNKPVPLSLFYDAVSLTYASRGFARQLAPEELEQLALQARFCPTAAAALRARAAADAAAEAWARSAGGSTTASSQAAHRGGATRSLPAVTIPMWRWKYFMWWLHR